MGVVSMTELKSNLFDVMGRVENGEVVEITKHGRVVAEIRPRTGDWLVDPQPSEARATLVELMDRGLDIGGPATYDERTAR